MHFHQMIWINPVKGVMKFTILVDPSFDIITIQSVRLIYVSG